MGNRGNITNGTEKKSKALYCNVLENNRICRRPTSNSQLTIAQRQRFNQLGIKFKRKSRAVYFACDVHLSLLEVVGKSQATKHVTSKDLAHIPKVNWSVLSQSSMKKYCRYFDIPDEPKKDLEKAIDIHFTKQPIQELETILGFVMQARKARSTKVT